MCECAHVSSCVCCVCMCVSNKETWHLYVSIYATAARKLRVTINDESKQNNHTGLKIFIFFFPVRISYLCKILILYFFYIHLLIIRLNIFL